MSFTIVCSLVERPDNQFTRPVHPKSGLNLMEFYGKVGETSTDPLTFLGGEIQIPAVL